MTNQDKNFAFYNLTYFVPEFPTIPLQSLWNYQQFSSFPYYWAEQNLTSPSFEYFYPFQNLQTFMPGNIYTCPNKAILSYPTGDANSLEIQNKKENFCFQIKNREILGKKTSITGQNSLSKLSQDLVNEIEQQDSQNDLSDSQKIVQKKVVNYQTLINNDKKTIQSLRYQRKNIEANIVNKIYTYLKTSLKNNLLRIQNSKDKQKGLSFFRILQKLQKTKKQTIKRQYLKNLIKIDESVNGFSKIRKQLDKKGFKVQEFEFFIRITIKYYLRLNAKNSILTSKKMNPSLWRDHLNKVRQLDEYLFSHQYQQEKQ